VLNAIDIKATSAYSQYSYYQSEEEVAKAETPSGDRSSVDKPDSETPELVGAWRNKADPPV
jgi:hypothetical protein